MCLIFIDNRTKISLCYAVNNDIYHKNDDIYHLNILGVHRFEYVQTPQVKKVRNMKLEIFRLNKTNRGIIQIEKLIFTNSLQRI